MSKKISFGALTLVMLFAFLVGSVAAVNYGALLSSGTYQTVGYSRVIKLANGHLLAAYTMEYADNSGAIKVYRSTDNGASFSLVSTFTDNSRGWQIGCPTLFEVSSGTILMAYNLFNDLAYEQGQDLKIVKSSDGGASWAAGATVESGVWNWEPEFVRSSDGKLQLYYSYASTLKQFNLSMFDQVIVRRESSDNGANWGSRTTVLGSLEGDNFGMPRIAKGGNTYYMAVEYYDDSGAVVLATSTDGKSWNTTKPAMETSSGWMFSTPALTYQNGALFGMGKTYKDSIWGNDGNHGKVMLKSTNGGASWTEVPLPFEVVTVGEKTNWSPTLLPLSNTSMFLITSSDVPGDGKITERFGTGAITTP